jgi:hypothetical protein
MLSWKVTLLFRRVYQGMACLINGEGAGYEAESVLESLLRMARSFCASSRHCYAAASAGAGQGLVAGDDMALHVDALGAACVGWLARADDFRSSTCEALVQLLGEVLIMQTCPDPDTPVSPPVWDTRIDLVSRIYPVPKLVWDTGLTAFAYMACADAGVLEYVRVGSSCRCAPTPTLR